MYNVLTNLRVLEGSAVGRTLTTIVKFRNDFDGIVDVFVQGRRGPVVSVEKSGDGWRAFADDSTWIHAETIGELLTWTGQKLSEILAARRIS